MSSVSEFAEQLFGKVSVVVCLVDVTATCIEILRSELCRQKESLLRFVNIVQRRN